MTGDEEKAFEDRLDGSDWAVPPMPDALVIAELRAEVERLRAALKVAHDHILTIDEAAVACHEMLMKERRTTAAQTKEGA